MLHRWGEIQCGGVDLRSGQKSSNIFNTIHVPVAEKLLIAAIKSNQYSAPEHHTSQGPLLHAEFHPYTCREGDVAPQN